MADMIQFHRPDGKTCDAYYVEPEGDSTAPGVVVIQEWWGLNDQIKGVADRLAAEGYRVVVPDLYRGNVTLDAAEANHLMSELDFADASTNDIAGAVQYLKQSGGKVGVVGFCMGGALSVLSAIHTDADCASSWYGIPPAEAGDVSQIRMPLQGHFALQDAFFTPAMADALEEKLKAAGLPYEFFRYEAGHAFGNETGDAYDPEATRTAWERTLSFFTRYLS